MTQIIVTSHGELAKGFISTLEFFTSDHNIKTLSLTKKGIDNFKNEVKDYLLKIPNEDILVLSDIMNGTPFNVFAELLSRNENNFEIVAGFNFSSLLSLVLSKENNLEKMVQIIKDTSEVKTFHEELINVNTKDDDE